MGASLLVLAKSIYFKLVNINSGAFSRNNFFSTHYGLFWFSFSVANAPDSDRKDLLSELELMKKLKPHPHVIKLMACVTESGKRIRIH